MSNDTNDNRVKTEPVPCLGAPLAFTENVPPALYLRETAATVDALHGYSLDITRSVGRGTLIIDAKPLPGTAGPERQFAIRLESIIDAIAPVLKGGRQ